MGVCVILGDFNICDREEGRFDVLEPLSFHTSLELAQSDYKRRDSSALGVTRTLSGIDRILINLPMAEARDFHCSSHVVENLGKKNHSE